jgi:hypothetical protein
LSWHLTLSSCSVPDVPQQGIDDARSVPVREVIRTRHLDQARADPFSDKRAARKQRVAGWMPGMPDEPDPTCP